MNENLKKNWWMLTVNGVIAILFGALSLFATEALLISISMYFGLLILIGGVLLLLGAFDMKRREKNYSMMLTESIVTIVIGLLIMIFPGESLRLFLIFIGIWALLLGIFKIYIAITFGKMLEYRFLLIIGGIILFAIGLILLLNPSYVAGFILQVFGAIFIILGMVLIYYSFAIKNANTGN